MCFCLFCFIEIPEVLFSIISTDVQGIVSRYLLQCVVVGATPAENILVKWYKNDVIIKSVHEPARTPVNTSSMLVVNVTRDENAVEVRFAINCSTAATTTFRMGWEYSAGKATVNNSYAFWKIDKLEDWTLQPICYVYPDIGSPCIETTPDLVSVSALEDGPMEAGSTYRLKCDIYNVAPAHNLSVKWYRDNTTLYTDHITTYDVTPRNVTSSLTITPLRSDHRSLFRCKAELHLGPRGPELPPTAASAPFVATVLCKCPQQRSETTEGRQKIITVTAATSTNAGFYICVATNKVGNVTRTVTLVMRACNRRTN
uniref:Ig-like domain-containing protein n=1 Tax=Nothobranchius furzeri TaxID=105023 RepID=A0A8C6NMP8_NOTFU